MRSVLRFTVMLGALLVTGTSAFAAGKGKGKGGGKHRKSPDPSWEGEFYFRPEAGVIGHGSGGGTTWVTTLGAQGGYRYWQVNKAPPTWAGRTRARVGYVLPSGSASGLDARVGSFIGPAWKYLALQAGPDLFWNTWDIGGDEIPSSMGVDLSSRVSASYDPASVWVSYIPSWLFNPDRLHVDWSEAVLPGFGHECTYVAGVGLSVSSFTVSLSYSYRILGGEDGNRTQQGFSVGAKVHG